MNSLVCMDLSKEAFYLS